MIIEWNPRQEEITGLARADTVGKQFWQVQQTYISRTEQQISDYMEGKLAIQDAIRNGKNSWTKKIHDLEINTEDGEIRFVQEHYLTNKTQQENNFKSIGLGYVAMARKEKHLFDLLYVSGKVPLDFENHIFPIDTDLLLNVMQKDPYLAGLAREDLLDLLGHMWIYTHGLTVLTSANPAVSEAFIHDALEKMGHRIVPGAMGLYGGMQALMIDPVTGTLFGAADPRQDGAALGF